MARDLFKPLSDYLKSSQKEWTALLFAPKESDEELAKQKQYEIGMKYLETGRYEDAVTHLKGATTSKRCKKDAYYGLAECYRQLHMLPLARKTYERLVRLDYHYKDVQEKMRQLDAPGISSAPGQPALSSQESGLAGSEPTRAIPAADRYQILETIYEGPCSRIYKVRDTLLGRIIALKQIDPAYPDREAYLQQLKEQNAPEHPNIVRIYDIDEAHGQIALEYVEGRNLRQILRLKGALTADVLIYIAIQLVNGLYHAHSHGIIHQALTPEHLLLTRQCALKLIAFRAPEAFLPFQKTADPYKYLYLPPEVLQRKELTVTANIYSLGVILYEMFTGRPPFALSQIKAFLHQPGSLYYDETPLPPAITPILRRCLAVLPEQRYTTIRTVGELLVAWYEQSKHTKVHSVNVTTYKDFLMMAWADGKITAEEATFLAHKRQELNITAAEAQQAEIEVKQELKELMRNA